MNSPSGKDDLPQCESFWQFRTGYSRKLPLKPARTFLIWQGKWISKLLAFSSLNSSRFKRNCLSLQELGLVSGATMRHLMRGNSIKTSTLPNPDVEASVQCTASPSGQGAAHTVPSSSATVTCGLVVCSSGRIFTPLAFMNCSVVEVCPPDNGASNKFRVYFSPFTRISRKSAQ